MPTYKAPIRDFQFILNELLEVGKYKDLAGFPEMTTELMDTIMSEGAKLCEEVLQPLNAIGDKEGCKFDKGKVTAPPGFKQAFETYAASGWSAFTCDPNYGGQGLPEVLNMTVTEMVAGANVAFGLTPGLTHGAYNAIHIHGSEEQKQKYLPNMASGKWTGVMCLTEPQAGTDLGLIRTKAEPDKDGSYKITGTKIFISCGEHDMAENIIHLVLARLPGAPAGSKGISLFVVPKFMIKDDGSLGAHNALNCGAIEHKMGIHASPTCVMNYEGAKGWLVGEANRGLKAMFTMMNEARIYVGIQGLGLAEVAYQNALQYAKERLQGRALKGAKFPEKPADPLIVHPDIRRMLLTMRSFTEGARALVMHTALQVDITKRSADPLAKELAEDFIQLITPIVKSYLTEAGSQTTNLGVQIFGGYGYIKEYGMEQFIRDARIAEIYEGANGIQALDLVGRKIPNRTGKFMRSFFHPISNFITENRDNPEMAEFTKHLYKALDSLQKASMWLAAQSIGNPDEAAGAASEYLKLFALVAFGFMWARMAKIALEKLKTATSEKEFYETKIATARFFMTKIMSQHYSLLASITSGVKNLEMPDCHV